MRYWWVNHKQTFDHEVGKGYIWCPKRKKDGSRNHFYETIREVQQGDLIFSYAFTKLQAVGVAKLPCYSCPRPDEFGKVGDAWDIRGWRVDVEFRRFRNPPKVANFSHQIAGLLPPRHSPIRADGSGNQGAYLSEISRNLAAALIEHSEPMLRELVTPASLNELTNDNPADPTILIEWEDAQQSAIENSLGLSETTRKALIQARRGQGKFKGNVSRFERACRITKVDNPTHLVASHIKPWREANNDERLSGANGLLLTPSIDHLFDRGFISFSDDGELLKSPVADKISLKRMGVLVDQPISVGRFNIDQKHFLDYHRREIFLKSEI